MSSRTVRNTALLGLASLAVGPVTAAPFAPPVTAAVADPDLVEVSLAELHPTQPAVGYDQIHYKLGRYAADPDKRFDDWCEADGRGEADDVAEDSRLDDPDSFACDREVGDESTETLAEMKTVVIGPGGDYYLTDGHHTFTAFWESADGGPDTTVRVRVVADLGSLSVEEFWNELRSRHWVWLFDENDAPITVGELPPHLGLDLLGDDRYRALVYFTGDIGYEAPDDATEYLEFYWAGWLRDHYDLDAVDLCDPDAYLDLIESAARDMVALDDEDVVADGRTAGELGRRDAFGDKEFDKLARPITDDDPGKLAYALQHRCG